MVNLQIIRSLCKEKNIKLKDLAEKIGIGENGLQRIINSNSTKIETLEKISDVLGVPIVTFFEDDKSTTPDINENTDLTPYYKTSPLSFFHMGFLPGGKDTSQLWAQLNVESLKNAAYQDIVAFLSNGEVTSLDTVLTNLYNEISTRYPIYPHTFLPMEYHHLEEDQWPIEYQKIHNKLKYQHKKDTILSFFSIPQVVEVFTNNLVSDKELLETWDYYKTELC